MKLELTAPTIHTPGFLEFCEKAPTYISTLQKIEKRGAALFTAAEASLIIEMFLYFTPLPPISKVPTPYELEAVEQARTATRKIIRACSAYELGQAIEAVAPALRELLEAQLPAIQ